MEKKDDDRRIVVDVDSSHEQHATDPPTSTSSISNEDKFCWTSFLSMIILSTGFLVLFIYYWWTPPRDGSSVQIHSFEYFVLCMFGGVFAGLPHTLLTPIDLVKCRVQTGEYNNMLEGFQSLFYDEGKGLSWFGLVRSFYRGWVPTFVGYSIQGAGKFGLYELFKHFYASFIFGAYFSLHHRNIIFFFASATAEFFADCGLAPWEAVKVRMQVTRAYPPLLHVVMPKMWFSEGLHGFFKGLPPLWCRQIPYTVVKFGSFENIVLMMYSVVLRAPKSSVGPGSQLAVSLASGCLSGALCAIVSHPADTLVSKLNQQSDKGTSMFTLLKTLPCRDLWKGIGGRIVFIGTLTAMQWLIYDSFKVMVGLPTTGGAAATMMPTTASP